MLVYFRNIDCPECRGPGTATVSVDRTNDEPLGMECSVCGLDIVYDSDDGSAEHEHEEPSAAPAATKRPGKENDAPLQRLAPAGDAQRFPEHLGAGWYRLSNGQKVRGKEQALSAQNTLTPPTFTSAAGVTRVNEEATAAERAALHDAYSTFDSPTSATSDDSDDE